MIIIVSLLTLLLVMMYINISAICRVLWHLQVCPCQLIRYNSRYGYDIIKIYKKPYLQVSTLL